MLRMPVRYRSLHRRTRSLPLLVSRAVSRLTSLTAHGRGRLPTATMCASLKILLGRACPLGGIFATGVLVARALGPRSYGLYSAAFALGALTASGTTAGLPVLMMRRAAQRDIDSLTQKRAAVIQLGYSVSASVLATVLGVVIFGGYFGASAGLLAGAGAAANNFATVAQSIHAGYRSYNRAVATDVTAGLLCPTLTVAALYLHTGIIGSLAALLLAFSFSCVVAWMRLPEGLPRGEASHLGSFEALPLTIIGALNGAYARVDAVVLVIVAGGTVTGLYSAAYRLLGPFALLGSVFVTMFLTRLSEVASDPARWSRLKRLGTVALVISTGLLVGVLVVLAPLLLRLFFGNGYVDAVTSSRLLLLSAIPWACYTPMASALVSKHLEKRVSVALLLGLGADIVLVFLLGHRFGAVGAAGAWLVSESAMFFGLLALTGSTRRSVGGLRPEC